MAKSKSEVGRGSKQVSSAYSLMLYNEETDLIEGIARALKKQGVPVIHDNGKFNKLMVIKEAVRQAAEKLGRETGDKSLVELAARLKVEFQTLKFRGRPSAAKSTHTAPVRAPISRKGK